MFEICTVFSLYVCDFYDKVLGFVSVLSLGFGFEEARLHQSQTQIGYIFQRRN